MKAPIATGYTSTILPTSVKTPIQSCEEKATMKMATMRFSSAQGASDYRKQLIEDCMATSQPSTTTVTTPTPTATVVNTVATNLAPTPVKTGVSAIVEPNFANVKVYDLDAPSGSPIGIPSGNAMVTSSSVDSVGSSESIIEGNGETISDTVSISQKPNYVLYGGIAISAIILYKILK